MVLLLLVFSASIDHLHFCFCYWFLPLPTPTVPPRKAPNHAQSTHNAHTAPFVGVPCGCGGHRRSGGQRVRSGREHEGPPAGGVDLHHRRQLEKEGRTRRERRVGVGGLGSSLRLYSPECVEGVFCDLRSEGGLRSSGIRAPMSPQSTVRSSPNKTRNKRYICAMRAVPRNATIGVANHGRH